MSKDSAWVGLYDEVIGIGVTGERCSSITRWSRDACKKRENYGKCSKYSFWTFWRYSVCVLCDVAAVTKLLSGIDLDRAPNVNFMDDVFSGMTGYSLMSFPDSLDLCYRCNPKLPSQKEQNEKIMGYEPINDMGDGFKRCFQFFIDAK
jgi:hypothetical protein